MRSDVASEFLFRQEIVQLNHASYGSPTRATWARLGALRRQLELDPAANLGAHLVPKLAEIADSVRTFLGLPGGQLAFALNTTEAHETASRSLLDSRSHFTVAMRDDEYESVRTTWCAAASHRSPNVSVALVGGAEIRGVLTADVTVQSVIASSTARRGAPTEASPVWARIVDASHAPGHVELDGWASRGCPTAVVGSLHKWLPAVRPAGFLWLSDDWTVDTHPAIASLRSPAEAAGELLAWRGTWDPTPHFAVPVAIEQWLDWQEAGLVGAAEDLADLASRTLAEFGLREWNGGHARAPRLRSFVVPDCPLETLKGAFAAAGIKVWIGSHEGETVLRLALNVYNDTDDIERVLRVLRDGIGPR
jgi:isopenicillin-N epimerase